MLFGPWYAIVNSDPSRRGNCSEVLSYMLFVSSTSGTRE